MKRIIFILCVVGLVVKISALNSSVTMLVHGGASLNASSSLKLKGHFILPFGLKPVTYIGVDCRILDWLSVEPAIGWDNEAILSTRFNVGRKLWSWSAFNLKPKSLKYYIFSQLDYKLTKWLQVGIETENWGKINEYSSIGFGPNILFNIKRGEVDVSMLYRVEEDNKFSQLNIRFQVFL